MTGVVETRARGRGGPSGQGRRWVILGILCVSLLVVSLDTTILNVALPVLARDLGASSSELQWVVDAYAIVFAGLLLVAGSLADRWGRKWLFVAGLVLFGAGSAASAFSGAPDPLIASRAFMGIGGAAIMPSTLSLLTSIFRNDADRQRAIGIWSGTTGLGIALGPIVGGWLLAHFWWGSVFLVNVPIVVGGIGAALWLVPNSKSPTPQRPDPAGALLSIAGMAVLLWGIIDAPSRGWSSPVVLGAVGGGLALLAGFVMWERRCDHPMLEMSLFRRRRFSVAIGAMAMILFTLMGALFLLTQYLQFSLGLSALETGIRIMPIAAVLLVMAPASTIFVRWWNTKVVVFLGMASISAGLAWLATTSVKGTYGDALPGLMLLGLGAGLAFAPSTDSIMGSLPPEESGVGAATNGAALETGGAIGVAVLGSLLNGRYEDHMRAALAGHHVAPSAMQYILGSLGGALEVAHRVGGTLGAALGDVGRQAFVSGMDLALTAGAAVAAAAALGVLALLPGRPQRDRGGVGYPGTAGTSGSG